MAANSSNFIRVRLYFDYPPPAVVDCRMCWLLVDLTTCRVVADLESIIREKFEFSPRSILNLFIEDCYLPHTERIFVVRDNDSVRVKVDPLAQVNGHSSCPDTASKNCRKRQRPTEEDGPGGNEASVELKEKKRKKRSEEILEGDAKQASGDERNKKSKGKDKQKKKAEKNSPASTPKPAVSTKKTPTTVDKPVKSTKKLPAAQTKPHTVCSSSDSSSSSSEEDEAPKKPPAPKPAKPASQKTPLSTSAASEAPSNTKPTQPKPRSTSSSSSETDCSSDEAPSVKNPPKKKPLTSMSPKTRINDNSKVSVLQSTNYAQKQANSIAISPDVKDVEPSNSDSEETIKLTVRQPTQQSERGVGSQSLCGGYSRGRAKCAGLGNRGRGRGRGVIRGNAGSFDSAYNGVKEPCYQTDSLINMSVVFQNGAESAPKRDYSSLPLLAAPPQVGQKIAFKLLELAENYTPEISEYKEGRIVSFDPTTKQIELELLHASQGPAEPGKFDLVYQNPDGSERVEYAVSRGAWVTEQWDSLLEPRLVI